MREGRGKKEEEDERVGVMRWWGVGFVWCWVDKIVGMLSGDLLIDG
jgi:hypothetical protein